MSSSTQGPSNRIVACPQCDSPVTWNEASEWRPFCSQRCKQIDLGEWFNESYTVAGESEFTSPQRDDWDN